MVKKENPHNMGVWVSKKQYETIRKYLEEHGYKFTSLCLVLLRKKMKEDGYTI